MPGGTSSAHVVTPTLRPHWSSHTPARRQVFPGDPQPCGEPELEWVPSDPGLLPFVCRGKNTPDPIENRSKRGALIDYPHHHRAGFRLRGVQPFSYRMVASRHRRHHRAQYQMSQPTVPLVLGKFDRSDDPSS
ncbi:hypothetical protein TNIN_430291 [Trichonephila inaurata madagascariensis]|uniref:Uncharacterized protein n=1 Tax=Trichonephila inaurata madagascariensis TaxID=2747483 RepID=A0A8X6MLH6_9ARAC|nr:hypothetical protein TNIN_430291 [Trichonephila inaurata madagascariensis]